MSKHSVLVFGAGNIGRGLIGDLAMAVGLELILVEAVAGFAQRLRDAGSYNVRLVGQSSRACTVSGYRVLDASDIEAVAEALTRCTFAAVAVGGAHILDVAPVLAGGLERRESLLNILVCENWPHADSVLTDALLSAGASAKAFSCVPSSVERMVRGTESTLDLVGEYGQTLFVSAPHWVGDRPAMEGLIFCENIEALYARKLFTNNAGHALLAYLGALEGCRFIHESVERPAIRKHLDELLDAAAQALIRTFDMDAAEMRIHLETLVAYRFGSRELSDSIARVARDPIRKLGPNERLVGLARMLEGHSLPTEPVSRVIGAALNYRDVDDPQSMALEDMIARDGTESVLRSVCGFDDTDPCFHECLGFYKQYKTTEESKQ
ncbi:MAG: hypothetical protein M1133_04820 [Armatimonadetes bacterium]|nr:hypothetical protein [Armatimonadota bacterium]